MWMLRAGGSLISGRGILTGFGLLFLCHAFTATGKTVTATPFPFPTVKRTAQLNYPPLPIEVTERIQGLRKKTASKTPNEAKDSAIARDWALSSVGFFDT